MSFDNGYGVSVIRTLHSLGGSSGLYELVLLKSDQIADVHGYLSRGEVTRLMFKVQQLPSCVVEDDSGFLAMAAESSERALQVLAEMEIDDNNECDCCCCTLSCQESIDEAKANGYYEGEEN